MKTVNLICPKCGKSFERANNEYRRSQRLGRKSFCSQVCASDITHIPVNKRHRITPKPHIDKYTTIRAIHTRLKRTASTRNLEFDLSLDDLLDLWIAQDGKCLFTGWGLADCSVYNQGYIPNRASLDRIDSTKGYVKGNIQWVSAMANYAKNQFTQEQMIDFCQSIAKKWVE